AEGNFNRAFRVEKEDAITVIPVTEDSGSRSGSAAFPHPLADKLEYIAGDYTSFVPGNKMEKYFKYMEQLEERASFPSVLPQRKSVYLYLKQGTVMHDLLQAGLFSFENGKISAEKQQGIALEDWFVRFSVDIPGKAESRLYCDNEVFDSYIEYYLSKQDQKELCYVSGEIVPCAEKHPAKVRHTADKAKLISSNDASGFFTYKGRFQKSGQVAMVSYEISQKAHNALRWLIAKQACLRVGEQVFVVWSAENPDLQNPFDEFSFCEEEETAYTDEEYAKQVKKAIWGSKDVPVESASVIVMGVEAATTGRLSIPFYQKYEAKQFVENISKWKTEVCWLKKLRKNVKPVPWSPSLIEIVNLVAGDKNDKLNKNMRERIIPCIVEGRRLPHDVVLSAVQKVINPMHYDNYFDWNNDIALTCALLRKWEMESGVKKEERNMELNEESRDRSYIFGQLLATAEMLERSALVAGNGMEAKRNTAAEKYFIRFQRYPVETYMTIRNQLQPYIMKLNSSGKGFYVKRLSSLESRLDFTQKNKLEPTFLQGYSCQLMSYRNFSKQENSENKEDEV
ncbi:MAG: type I-C CRISPR-associated protein Cas8c/Csd1, partial [Lachnospiraceae bacterium]